MSSKWTNFESSKKYKNLDFRIQETLFAKLDHLVPLISNPLEKVVTLVILFPPSIPIRCIHKMKTHNFSYIFGTHSAFTADDNYFNVIFKSVLKG